MFMISEKKLDESFPPGQLLLDGHSVPFRSDRDRNGADILLFIREDVPLKPMNYQWIMLLKVFS